MRKTLILLVLAGVAIGFYFALNFSKQPNEITVIDKTTVKTTYSLGDISDLADVKVYINNESVDPLLNELSISEPSVLRITKPGYSEFSTKLDNTGKTTTVYAKLTPISDSTISSLADIRDSGLNSRLFSLGDVEYFHEKTWAVIDIESDITDPASIVARYDAVNNIWVVVLGPGTGFEYTDTLLVPDAVKRRMITQHNRSGDNI